MQLIIQIMFDIWNLTNKSVTNFLSLPSFKIDAPYKLISLFLNKMFHPPPIKLIFQKFHTHLEKGGLELWTKLIEQYFFAIKVNIHFCEAKFGNNHYVANATFFTKNLI